MKRALFAVMSTVVAVVATLGHKTPSLPLDQMALADASTDSVNDGPTKVVINGQELVTQADGSVTTATGEVVTDPALVAAANEQASDASATASAAGSSSGDSGVGGTVATGDSKQTTSTSTSSGDSATTTVTQSPASTVTTATPATQAPATTAAPTTTTTKAPTTTTTTQAPSVTKSATASVPGKGDGTVTVTITVKSGKVTACTSTSAGVTGESKQYTTTSNLGSLCSKAVSTNASSVSKTGGATLTTNAFNSALASARSAAGI